MTYAVDQKTTAFELISFCIGEQEFCLDIMSVREIRGWAPATPLPHSRPYVRGIINLRGAVLPIVDLRARLGLGNSELTERSVTIVVQMDDIIVGLVVDAVSEIIAVTPDQVQPTPRVAMDSSDEFVRGVLPMDGRLISWIALERILPELRSEAA